MTQAPVIKKQRVRLRPHVMSDMEAFWAFYQTPRARYVNSPKNPTHLWFGLASEVGSWAPCGWGGQAIEDTQAARYDDADAEFRHPRPEAMH